MSPYFKKWSTPGNCFPVLAEFSVTRILNFQDSLRKGFLSILESYGVSLMAGHFLHLIVRDFNCNC